MSWDLLVTALPFVGILIYVLAVEVIILKSEYSHWLTRFMMYPIAILVLTYLSVNNWVVMSGSMRTQFVGGCIALIVFMNPVAIAFYAMLRNSAVEPETITISDKQMKRIRKGKKPLTRHRMRR